MANQESVTDAAMDRLTDTLVTTLAKRFNLTGPDKHSSPDELSIWVEFLEAGEDKSKYTITKYKGKVSNFADRADSENVENVTNATNKTYRENLLRSKGLKANSVNLILVTLNPFRG